MKIYIVDRNLQRIEKYNIIIIVVVRVRIGFFYSGKKVILSNVSKFASNIYGTKY